MSSTRTPNRPLETVDSFLNITAILALTSTAIVILSFLAFSYQAAHFIATTGCIVTILSPVPLFTTKLASYYYAKYQRSINDDTQNQSSQSTYAATFKPTLLANVAYAGSNDQTPISDALESDYASDDSSTSDQSIESDQHAVIIPLRRNSV